MPTSNGCTTTARTAACPGAPGTRPSGCWVDRHHRPRSLRVTATSSWEPPTTPPATHRARTAADPRWPPRWPPPPRPGTTPTPGSRPWRPCPPGSSGRCGRSPPRRPTPGSAIPSTTWRRSPTTRRTASPAGSTIPRPASTRCLQAINHAHALEGIRPMVLPADFAQLSIPDQLFVAVNLERVDRGLPAFGGLTTALNRNAQRGADTADDPPDPGRSYDLDDARVGGRLVERARRRLRVDVRRRLRQRQPRLPAPGRRRLLGPPQGHPRRLRLRPQPGHGCRHRHERATPTSGDQGGTSMAVTLAVAAAPVTAFTYSWAQVTPTLPPSTG